MIIPGPIVDETVTFLMNGPLVEEGLFLIIASNKDFKFSFIDFSENSIFPIEQ